MTDYSVYKNMPFRVVLRKNKYLDKVIEKSINANTTDTVQLEAYRGLTVTYNKTLKYITVAAGDFADGTSHATEEKFALVAKGQTATIDGVEMAGVLADGDSPENGVRYELFYYNGEFYAFMSMVDDNVKYRWCGTFTVPPVSYFPTDYTVDV